jgi:hypothetical protein
MCAIARCSTAAASLSCIVEHVPPLAVTLNDVIVDAESLLVATSAHAWSDSGASTSMHERSLDLERVVSDLKRDMASVAADENACLERCQFSLYALIDAARLACNGLDADDALRTMATACRRKAQATLFTVQWLLARRVQHA